MAKKKSKRVQDEFGSSVHKIWLAGLGALSSVEEEGEKLFKNLVSKGEKYETKAQRPIDKVRSGVKKARTRAGETWDNIETAFDERVGSVLNRLGVPTRDEIAKLTRKVERLTKAVGTRTPPAKPAARKKPVTRKKKAAAKTTKRKKTA